MLNRIEQVIRYLFAGIVIGFFFKYFTHWVSYLGCLFESTKVSHIGFTYYFMCVLGFQNPKIWLTDFSYALTLVLSELVTPEVLHLMTSS